MPEKYDINDENMIFFKSAQIDPGSLGGGSRHQTTSKSIPGGPLKTFLVC
jgi:hypothetical protein